jgi:hypothetical protein
MSGIRVSEKSYINLRRVSLLRRNESWGRALTFLKYSEKGDVVQGSWMKGVTCREAI